jgi:hypothetical protein
MTRNLVSHHEDLQVFMGVRWAEYVALMEETRSMYRVFIMKPAVKWLLGKPRIK